MGQLGKVWLEIGRVRSLERLADLSVQPHAARGVQLGVDRLADEGVGEVVAVALLAEHARPKHLVQGIHERVELDAAGSPEHLEGEALAQDRAGPQQPIRLGTQPRQPLADHLAHPLRDAPRHVRYPRVDQVSALRPEMSHHLLQEERVALRLAIDRLDQRRSRLPAAQPCRSAPSPL